MRCKLAEGVCGGNPRGGDAEPPRRGEGPSRAWAHATTAGRGGASRGGDADPCGQASSRACIALERLAMHCRLLRRRPPSWKAGCPIARYACGMVFTSAGAGESGAQEEVPPVKNPRPENVRVEFTGTGRASLIIAFDVQPLTRSAHAIRVAEWVARARMRGELGFIRSPGRNRPVTTPETDDGRRGGCELVGGRRRGIAPRWDLCRGVS